MNGIVNIYKPLGISSYGVVGKVKRILNIKKVGHTGTLDPEAEGVLPVCIGKGTKLSGMLTDATKKYRAKIKLGVTTDSQDAQGNIIKTSDVNITYEDFCSAAADFVGEIQQIPPMYSAIKKDGKKLYELARQGIEVERAPRKITIFSIDIIEFEKDVGIIDVFCSKGTYIRTLCHDIGESLGTGAIMQELTRTASGRFNIESSVTLEKFVKNPEQYIIPVEDILDIYPKYTVNEEQEFRVKNGCTVPVENINQSQIYRVYSKSGEFLCLSVGVNPDKPCLKLHTAFF